MAVDVERRFGGVSPLRYGGSDAAVQRPKVAVSRYPGAGSWAAEALARSGVGAPFGRSRHGGGIEHQPPHPRLDSNLARPRSAPWPRQIAEINPNCQVCQKEEFATPENIADPLEPSLMGDRRDRSGTRKSGDHGLLPKQWNSVVTVGAAGGQIDPHSGARRRLEPHGARPRWRGVRSDLRRHCGFPRERKALRNFGSFFFRRTCTPTSS